MARVSGRVSFILKSNKIQLVIINGQISPIQQQNLEKKWKVKILDRTALILEIFSDRAVTKEGVLQVEMAALTYQRSRLVRAGLTWSDARCLACWGTGRNTNRVR